MTQHRKVAVSFRDRCLLQVFEISLTILNQLACRSISLEGYEPAKREATENQLLDQALQLAVACLRYDFIGTNPDESAEDVGASVFFCFCFFSACLLFAHIYPPPPLRFPPSPDPHCVCWY